LFAAVVVMGLTAPPWVLPAALAAQQGQPPAGGRGGQRAARDRATPAQPAGTAAVAGRVVTADTGQPIKRARVVVAGGGRAGRSTTTDDQGRFQVAELAAGSYTVAASKAGFVDGAYGQRRPLQPGTPIDVGDGQQISNADVRLVRGGVITGRILDEDGEPLARALVTVQRYQYIRGERQLVPAGGDQSDDRGVYRVFGLPPGSYYISANAAGLGQLLGRGMAALTGAPGAALPGRGGRGLFGLPEEPEPTGYAPTYYPGVVSAGEAGRVAVAPGQEVTGIDFQVLLVPLVTVSGFVAGAEGTVPVMLVPAEAGGLPGMNVLRSASRADGTFSIGNVPPGRYTAIARDGGFNDAPRMARQAVIVNGQNVTGLALTLQPGVTLAGNITVESSGTPAPSDYTGFRIDVPEVDPLPVGGGGRGGRGGGGTTARAEKNGAFAVENLMPGRHYIRVTGQNTWALKSISIGGRDVTDDAIELQPGQNLDSVLVVLTDRATAVTGTVRDAAGRPMPGLTVIAFASDSQYWHAQSRFIQTARADASGVYRLRGLPPGSYLVLATDNVETGEWFDPAFLEQAREAAQSLSLDEGEQRTLDLSGPSS
jgi:protocatechuate 3,4-dioxygenase beta subunit